VPEYGMVLPVLAQCVQAVDDLLQPLGVKYLVLPALKGDPLNIWTKHFGFRPVSPMELKVKQGVTCWAEPGMLEVASLCICQYQGAAAR
jgi:hypothetical protein